MVGHWGFFFVLDMLGLHAGLLVWVFGKLARARFWGAGVLGAVCVMGFDFRLFHFGANPYIVRR